MMMSEITEHVGRLIRETRKSKGLTQKELGERLGITEASFNRYENGSANLSIETIKKIADALEVSIKLNFE